MLQSERSVKELVVSLILPHLLEFGAFEGSGGTPGNKCLLHGGCSLNAGLNSVLRGMKRR